MNKICLLNQCTPSSTDCSIDMATEADDTMSGRGGEVGSSAGWSPTSSAASSVCWPAKWMNTCRESMYVYICMSRGFRIVKSSIEIVKSSLEISTHWTMTFGNDYDVALISHLFKFRQSCCMFGLEVSCNTSQPTSSKVVRETENSSSPSCSLAWSSSLCSRPSPWGWGTHWYTNTLWCASCVCRGGRECKLQ